MAGNGRRCRSRWDNAADVAQTVRAGALSPQDLMSRHAGGRLTALLKLDVEQLKEAVAAPPTVECGSVADGRIPRLGCQTPRSRVWRVAERLFTLGGPLGKSREPQIILKTDQRNLIVELGLGGKFQAKSSGWNENRTFPKAMFLKLNTQWRAGC
jgi:hypothetical protein